MGKHMATKKANASKTYAEKVDQSIYGVKTHFTSAYVPTGTWAGMMKDAAWYFDKPSLKDEVEMRHNL